MEKINEKHKLYSNMVKEMKDDFFNFLNCEEKLKLYNEVYDYFLYHMLMYMKENYNVSSFEYIDNWGLTKNSLTVNYYDEFMDDDEYIDIPINEFLNYIKSKENGNDM
jgi:hypothetical protein